MGWEGVHHVGAGGPTYWNPSAAKAVTRAFFGATVRYANAAGVERVVSIVGTDEVDLDRNHISWVSPLGRALMKSAAGDRVVLQAPAGTEHLTVLEVCYQRIAVEPFREPPGSEASAKGRQATSIHLTNASEAAREKFRARLLFHPDVAPVSVTGFARTNRVSSSLAHCA